MDRISCNLEKLEQLNRAAERLLNDLKIVNRKIEKDIELLNRGNKRIKMLLSGYKAVKRPEQQ